jgi:ribosomal protein L40E
MRKGTPPLTWLDAPRCRQCGAWLHGGWYVIKVHEKDKEVCRNCLAAWLKSIGAKPIDPLEDEDAWGEP